MFGRYGRKAELMEGHHREWSLRLNLTQHGGGPGLTLDMTDQELFPDSAYFVCERCSGFPFQSYRHIIRQYKFSQLPAALIFLL